MVSIMHRPAHKHGENSHSREEPSNYSVVGVKVICGQFLRQLLARLVSAPEDRHRRLLSRFAQKSLWLLAKRLFWPARLDSTAPSPSWRLAAAPTEPVSAWMRREMAPPALA